MSLSESSVSWALKLPIHSHIDDFVDSISRRPVTSVVIMPASPSGKGDDDTVARSNETGPNDPWIFNHKRNSTFIRYREKRSKVFKNCPEMKPCPTLSHLSPAHDIYSFVGDAHRPSLDAKTIAFYSSVFFYHSFPQRRVTYATKTCRMIGKYVIESDVCLGGNLNVRTD